MLGQVITGLVYLGQVISG